MPSSSCIVFSALEIKIVKSLDLFLFLSSFLLIWKGQREHRKFNSYLSPVGLEPRKATSLTQLPLAGTENNITFFLFHELRHLLSHPSLGFIGLVLAALRIHGFVSSQLSWLKSCPGQRQTLPQVVPFRRITACPGKCCDLMPQILTLQGEMFGFCLWNSKAGVAEGLAEVLMVPALRSGKKVPPSPCDPAGLLHNCAKPA